MGFIFLVILVIVVLHMIMPSPGSGFTGKKEKTWCPPHKWEYDSTGFLYCTECKGRPGYEGRE